MHTHTHPHARIHTPAYASQRIAIKVVWSRSPPIDSSWSLSIREVFEKSLPETCLPRNFSISAMLPIRNTKMSGKSVTTKPTVVESHESPKDVACESKECSSKKKKERVPSEKPTGKVKETVEEATRKVHEIRQSESPRDIKDVKSEIVDVKSEIKDVESEIKDVKSEIKDVKSEIKDVKSEILIEAEVTKMRETKSVQKAESAQKAESVQKAEFVHKAESVQKAEFVQKAESAKTIKDDRSEIDVKYLEKDPVEVAKPTESAKKTNKHPVLDKTNSRNSWSAAVPRTWPPMSTPRLEERPLVLSTHLVPSLPIDLFVVLAEIIEVVTKRSVVLLYEHRIDRSVPKDVADIAVLPAAENWKDGVLLPASFVFQHRLNRNNSPCVYVDVIVAADRAPHVEDIMDLRGHRCAIPDRRNQISAAGLLFSNLRTKGESPAFFGNMLDANSQLAVLQMIAGKQAEVGVLDAPVIRCHQFTVPGVESLSILASMGPLPPYRIMINKAIVDTIGKKLATYLLNINQYEEHWMDMLSPFGVVGFAENSMDYYNLDDVKSIVTSVPYY